MGRLLTARLASSGFQSRLHWNLSNLTSVRTRHSYGFSEMKFGFWRHFGLAGIVTLAYFSGGAWASLASVHTNVSPVWPPTGTLLPPSFLAAAFGPRS